MKYKMKKSMFKTKIKHNNCQCYITDTGEIHI